MVGYYQKIDNRLSPVVVIQILPEVLNMLIDYANDQIILTEELNESFITLQDMTNYRLCERIRDGKYQIPYIALPIVVNACKKSGYPIRYTDALKSHHAHVLRKRDMLESIKTGDYSKDDPEINDIIEYIKSMESSGNFKLSPEQIDSVVFGIIGRRILIANEIGTGKTLVVNMIARYLIDHNIIKKVIVMVPAKLVNNFKKDYIRFFGKEGIISLRKETKDKRSLLYKQFATNENVKILVTNYEKCYFDYDDLLKVKCDMIVVDEFHIMKNFMGAKRSINFFSLIKNQWKPIYRYPMSGTPIENRLFDLFPVFKLLDGGNILGGQKFFECNFIEYENKFFKVKIRNSKKVITRNEVVAVGFKNHVLLKSLIKPLVIRKKLLLPVGKYQNFIEIELDSKVKEAYEALKRNTSGASARYHATRQFLCDPMRENITSNKKLEELQNILDQTSEKIVIFTFYHAGVDALSKYLTDNGIKYYKITGKEQTDATEVIEKFKNDKDAKCLIGTDAINFGHNIQFCRFVVNYDIPIKPTTYDQRIGRLYRKGQQNDVHVYNFYVADTVEEKIYEQFEAKKDLIDTIMDLDDEERIKIENEIEKAVMKEFE